MDPLVEYKTDHDLLVELRTEFRGMRQDIQRLTDGTNKRADDHELRIRWLESRGWMLAGGAIGASTVINYLLQAYNLFPHA